MPEAQKAGLKVWFDKDDLRPGTPWSAQIAQAIQTYATALADFVGSKGVMTWVEAEVRVALSRAIADTDFPFMPVLAGVRRTRPSPPALIEHFARPALMMTILVGRAETHFRWDWRVARWTILS